MNLSIAMILKDLENMHIRCQIRAYCSMEMEITFCLHECPIQNRRRRISK